MRLSQKNSLKKHSHTEQNKLDHDKSEYYAEEEIEI